MQPFLFTSADEEAKYQDALRNSRFVVNYPEMPSRRRLHLVECGTISFETNREPKYVFADEDDLDEWMIGKGIESIPVCQKSNQPCKDALDKYGKEYVVEPEIRT